MTYTVFNRHGSLQGSGLDLESAAKAVLNYDGHDYEIRAENNGFRLWVSSFSRNSSCFNGLKKSVIVSFKASQAEAEAEIQQGVIDNAEWFNNCTVESQP